MSRNRYPKAIWKGDGKTAGAYTSGPFKIVLHTTETSAMPGYSNGANAPHLTYDPKTRKWTQHTNLDVSARSLVNNAGGAQTNRDSALQVEIICYSNKAMASSSSARMWVGDLSASNLADLRDFIDWAGVNYGVKLKWPGKIAKTYAAANAAGFRMTTSEWDNWDGVCGHQHVPEGNTHYDPAELDWPTLMAPPIGGGSNMAVPSYAQEAWEWMISSGMDAAHDDSEFNTLMTEGRMAVFFHRFYTRVLVPALAAQATQAAAPVNLDEYVKKGAQTITLL